MVGRLKLALGLSAVMLLLAGCASERPASTGTGRAARQAPPGVGIYKVGSPYKIDGVWYYPAEDWSYDETGIASWYGRAFEGKDTANGEVFDPNALTAAHRTLPMPSIVQVTNLGNGRSIRLRVNDRGPYARGRIIDVSRRAAQLLGFETAGTAKVRVKILVPETIQAESIARHHSAVAAVPSLPPVPVAPVAAEALPTPPGVKVASAGPPPVLGPPPPARLPPAPLPAATPAALPDAVTTVPVHPTHIYVQAGAFAQAGNATRLKARLDKFGKVVISGARVNGVNLYRVRLGPVASVDEADRLLNRIVDSGVPEARIVVD
jgi:rare lipoprotein A